ncbi:DUF397 domain-containing protein [Actinoallomurus vinaceus]|uniref:DUF397 domain-containing protein n=1 Tax=Actinoallomurus vinaceus TaxID=1080074 RepID=UPI003CD05ED1
MSTIRALGTWRKSSYSGQEGTDCVEVLRVDGPPAVSPGEPRTDRFGGVAGR